MAKASAAYPNQVEIEESTLRVWVERLADMDANQALKNLNNHIDTSRFFPTIADIIKHEPDQFVDYKALREETKQKIARIALAGPVMTQEERNKISEAVRAGLLDEKYKDDPWLGGGL